MPPSPLCRPSSPRWPRILAFVVAGLWSGATASAQAPSKAIGIDEAVAAVEPAIRPPNRYALVVGVAQYQDARVPDLPACERDATVLTETLVHPAIGLFPPGQVTTLVNEQVTRTSVVAALDELAQKAGPDDLVLIYFSGHGATDEKGRAYWVMHDSQPDRLRSTALPELEISELLGEIKTRRLVTIIDACYAAATASLGTTKSLIDLQKVYPAFTGDGRVGMTASKGDQLSIVITNEYEPGYGHSAFTYHIIEGLRGSADARGNSDGVIELDELWSYVKDRTVETARRQGGNQEPQLKGQVGSRFLLAIDGQRLTALAQAKARSHEHADTQLEALKKLIVDERITGAMFDEAKALLRAPIDTLGTAERAQRERYIDLADGRIGPEVFARLMRADDARLAVAPGAQDAGQRPLNEQSWSEAAASFSSRFSDLDAPVAIALDLAALRDEPRLTRYAEAFSSWGSMTWSDDAGGTPRRAVLVGEPLPQTSDATFLPRGMIRQHRGDGALDALLASPVPSNSPVVTRLIAPRISASILGDGDAFDQLIDRASTLRPSWARALTGALRSDAAIGVVADGPWCIDRLRAFAGDDGGRIFVGKIYATLTLRDDPEMPRIFAEATEAIQSVALVALPTADAVRATITLTFTGAAAADRAAPHWRLFLGRLSDWAPGTRGLDVQCADERLILRVDVPLAALLDWVDARLGLPGSRAGSTSGNRVGNRVGNRAGSKLGP